ncbi:uncharacterized [Tachysurus ichikawai]
MDSSEDDREAEGKKGVRLEGGGQAAHTSGEALRMRNASSSLSLSPPNICLCVYEYHWHTVTPSSLITVDTL